MPEQEHDSLEQFFRKAAGGPQVSFNEDDWKKLEARLDAVAAGGKVPSAGAKTYVKALVIAALLVSSIAVWVSSTSDVFDNSIEVEASAERGERPSPSNAGKSHVPPDASDHVGERVESNPGDKHQNSSPTTTTSEMSRKPAEHPPSLEPRIVNLHGEEQGSTRFAGPADGASGAPYGLPSLDKDKIMRELIVSHALARQVRQEAVVELPGAEEAGTPGAKTMVKEEHASDQKEHVAIPRVSLLLSFAPDFSGTSFDRYSAPGKAFGAMIHYHAGKRWSIAAGVIKNDKQYTGDGEDYEPPRGYWKYYTNGIIPQTIDGSCSILEFPVMVQYTIRSSSKDRWLVGAGASSYLMQTESYRYTFSEPNPGAKEGWNSRRSSQFLFNMMNLTLGYEHQVMPALMVGVEPYMKIPLEKIGWVNLKLYSYGASVTLRYTVIRRRTAGPTMLGRGPD